ncbi:MAG: type IV pilus assembly protein PilM [Acidimicrobiia bacterium]
MATRVIGLDIGTHAVRAVEVSVGRGQPVIEKMGQVALPAGAVTAGEVTDPAAVSAALRRLWRDVAFSSREVVVGVANARVVARMTEMPALPEQELRSSLPYHVQELIPIPVEEAQLDFQITEHFVTEEGEERVKLMLVAAQRDMLRTLLAAVTAAGLRASRVDLVALALIRALYSPGDWLVPVTEGEDADLGAADRTPFGQEVIIGVGAGITNVVVHHAGVPSFIRTVPSGGNAVTEALAHELGVGSPEAEGMKRDGSVGELALATRTAVAPVVGEVVGSLDFHRSSTDGQRVRRVVLSGGGSRLLPLQESLADQLGMPVDLGDPYREVRVGKVGIDPAVVTASSDLFTVALGLALSGVGLDGPGSRITLLPAEVQAERAERRQLVLAGAGVGVLALGLVATGFLRGAQAGSIRSDASEVETATQVTEARIAELKPIEDLDAEIATRRQTAVVAATGDIEWKALVQEIAGALPEGVWLSSIAGTRGQSALSTVQFAGTAPDQPAVARFLLAMDGLDALDGTWLGGATADETTGLVTFTASTNLTEAAGSGRAATFRSTK